MKRLETNFPCRKRPTMLCSTTLLKTNIFTIPILSKKRIVDEQYRAATTLLIEHRASLDRVAETLVKHETLSGDEVAAVLAILATEEHGRHLGVGLAAEHGALGDQSVGQVAIEVVDRDSVALEGDVTEVGAFLVDVLADEAVK